MNEDEYVTAAMNALAPFSYVLEEFASSLGWRVVRMGDVHGAGMVWNLWLPEQVLAPVPMLALIDQDIQVYYRHYQTDFSLADSKCFDKLEKRLAKLQTAVRAAINKRTAKLRTL